VGGHDAGSLTRRSPGEPRERIIERVGEAVSLFPFLRAEHDDVDPVQIGCRDADSLAGRRPDHPVHVLTLCRRIYLFSLMGNA